MQYSYAISVVHKCSIEKKVCYSWTNPEKLEVEGWGDLFLKFNFFLMFRNKLSDAMFNQVMKCYLKS